MRPLPLQTAATVSPRSVSYTLDKMGNRTKVTDNGVATPYTPDVINRYSAVGAEAPGYGGSHQLTSYATNGYSYIGDTLLARVTRGANTYTLGYDALGRCVRRTFNNAITYYGYDGDRPIQENGATLASTVYGNGVDEPMIRFEAGNIFFFYPDHQGSITHVANLSGLIEQYRYDAFGKPTIFNAGGTTLATSAINNRFLFTGREWAQGSLGFYEYRARAYHPGLGRFLTEDPLGFDAGDYNLFRYVGNDPLDRTDPTGEISEVTVDGDEISIRIPIQFSGEGATEEVTGRYVAGIEKAWNGQFGQYHVTTRVDTEHGIGKYDRTNKIEIVKDSKYRSNVVDSKSGTWNNSGDKKMAGHEGAHLMGQGDQYKDVKQKDGTVRSVPNPRYEKNIMGNMSAPPSTQDIKDIISNKKVNEIIVIPQKTGP